MRLLHEAGFASPNAAAVAAGRPYMLRDFARGKSRTMRADSLAALAEVLKRPMEEVATALGLPEWPASQAQRQLSDSAGREPFDANYPKGIRAPVRPGPLLPVRYVVQAGAWIEVDEAAQARLPSPPVAADPKFPRDAQWLELVRGDSADLFYPEGVYVHVVDAVAIGYAPRHEDFVVVERKRQQGGLIERSLKQIAIARHKIELWPRSRNPKWNAPLQLAEESDQDTSVEIAALVLGGYLPARR